MGAQNRLRWQQKSSREPPRPPRMSPRELQNALKIIFGSNNREEAAQERPKRAQRAKGSEHSSPFGSIWRPKSAPKRPPRAPKRSPRGPQNALKTIFVSKTLIFQKSMNVLAKIKVFEVRKVILGAQNRPQEAPREDKKRLRIRYNNKRREEGQQGQEKETM